MKSILKGVIITSIALPVSLIGINVIAKLVNKKPVQEIAE